MHTCITFGRGDMGGSLSTKKTNDIQNMIVVLSKHFTTRCQVLINKQVFNTSANMLPAYNLTNPLIKKIDEPPFCYE